MNSGRSTAVAVLTAGMLLTLVACAAEPSAATGEPTLSAPALHPASTPTSSPQAPPLRVVALGDSVMSGFGLSPDEAWPELLGARADLDLVNLACAGDGFVVTGDCGTAYSGFVPAVAALQPQLILVESSSNDFWEDGDEIRTDTADTVWALHDAAPDARIVGLSTIWNDDPNVPDDTTVTSDALRDAVDAVGGIFVDVGQPLVGHPEWMQPDDVHPTPRGQRAIEQTVMSALQDADVLP